MFESKTSSKNWSKTTKLNLEAWFLDSKLIRNTIQILKFIHVIKFNTKFHQFGKLGHAHVFLTALFNISPNSKRGYQIKPITITNKPKLELAFTSQGSNLLNLVFSFPVLFILRFVWTFCSFHWRAS